VSHHASTGITLSRGRRDEIARVRVHVLLEKCVCLHPSICHSPLPFSARAQLVCTVSDFRLHPPQTKTSPASPPPARRAPRPRRPGAAAERAPSTRHQDVPRKQGFGKDGPAYGDWTAYLPESYRSALRRGHAMSDEH